MNILYDNEQYIVGWQDHEDHARYEQFGNIKDVIKYLLCVRDVHINTAGMHEHDIALIAETLSLPNRLEYDDPLTGKAVVWANVQYWKHDSQSAGQWGGERDENHCWDRNDDSRR